jgi:hypothetical protein
LKGKTQRGENLKNKVPAEKYFSLYLKQQERAKKLPQWSLNMVAHKIIIILDA